MIIKIFTVTKNEYDLINPWVHFYGTIFGYENVVIIDNGSDNIEVLNFYNDIKKNTKIKIYTDTSIYSDQGKIFTKYMNLEKNNCDFLLGCDTDNFLIVDGKNSIKKQDYFDIFEQLPEENNKFLIHRTIDSIIDSNNSDYIDNKINNPVNSHFFIKHASVCANFYRSANFVDTYNGNHIGTTNPDQTAFNCSDKLLYVHYVYTGINRCMERSILCCEGYNYLKLKFPLSKFENSKDNFMNICNCINLVNLGVHRYIYLFSYILRYYLYSLFSKYVPREYFTLKNFYNILYNNENFLNGKNKHNAKVNSYFDERNFGSVGNLSFVEYKIKIKDTIENDFIIFFNSTVNNNKSFSIDDIFKNDENINFKEISKKHNVIEFYNIKKFFEKN
jgi:hypothetical protein